MYGNGNMKQKTYLSRSQSRFWSSEFPIGDATGGPAYGELNDPVTAMVGGGLLGAVISSNGAQSAANTQASAANSATAAQQGMFNTEQANLAPFLQSGQTAIGQLSNMTAPGGSLTHQFDASDLNANMAPNYQFIKDQGMGAVNNQASVGGGLVGGNALKGIADYSNNLAGNAYQQAYNNYNTNQSNIFNRLSTIAGMGQASGANSATGASAFSNGIANTTSAAGTAAAGGAVGTANALTSGINNATGMNYLGSLMNGSQGSATPANMTGFYTPTATPTYQASAPALGSGMWGQ